MNSITPTPQGMNVRARMLAATLGAGVIVTMGALTVALGDTEAHATPPTTSGAGSTTIQTTAPPAPVIPIAAPSVTAKKFAGKGWPGP
ncbi:MAG: hypothetical protein JWR32_2516 [Mycobacterium sp.]|nr:hypothetical protein [Mycobacterium sp.]